MQGADLSTKAGVSNQQSVDAGGSNQQSVDAGVSNQQSVDAGVSNQQSGGAVLPPFNRPPPFVPSTARQHRNDWARSCATSSGYRHSRHSCQHGRPIRYCRKCKSTDNQQTYPSLFQQQRDLMNQVLRMIYDIFGIRISATVLEDFILRQRRY